MGVQVKQADVLFKQSMKYHESARQNFAADLYDKAYQDATRALRPLRVIMRDHWLQATATLDTPTASPYAVSFFTLAEALGTVRGDADGVGPVRMRCRMAASS